MASLPDRTNTHERRTESPVEHPMLPAPWLPVVDAAPMPERTPLPAEHAADADAAGRRSDMAHAGSAEPDEDLRRLASVSLVAAHVRRTSNAHRAYLDAQLSLHRDFLTLLHGGASRAVTTPSEQTAAASPTPATGDVDIGPITLSLETEPWLDDHRLLYTVAFVPMMVAAELLAQGATIVAGSDDRRIVALSNVRMHRWMVVGSTPLRVERTAARLDERAVDVTLRTWREARRFALSRLEPAASGRIEFGRAYLPPPVPLASFHATRRILDVYEQGPLFHGPAFQVIREIAIGPRRASAALDAAGGTLPRGLLSPVLLDGVAQVAGIWDWYEDRTRTYYPTRVTWLHYHGPAPTRGDLSCEIALADEPLDGLLRTYDIQVSSADGMWVSLQLEMVRRHAPWLASTPPAVVRTFARDGLYVPDVLLTRPDPGGTRLTDEEVRRENWLPGSLNMAYRIPDHEDLTSQIAIKEHVARRAQVHPRTIQIAPDLASCRLPDGTEVRIRVERSESGIIVNDADDGA